MPNIRRYIVFIAALVANVPSSGFGATITVSKTGDAHYQSIQSAVNAAQPGDEVVILDTEVYTEMVTIDSTKNGLVLRSENRLAASKPAIRYQDKIHVGPRDATESLFDSAVDFHKNGALRILSATEVRIEGIVIDGGEVYPFGYDAVWEGRYALQHGNAAITIVTSGDVVVRDCEIRNAYFGIYITDNNVGGIYTRWYPADPDSNPIIPFSGFARTGNYLIEYNRIHNNSCGVSFAYMWNLGSTIRYNLFYENHHPTAAVATKVKALTSEGGNQCGGALIFKDHLLSPLAIYNNTFWHNSLIFTGNWRAGGQHLIFNNIYGQPNEYFSNSITTFATSFEMSKCFANRMHNCVYAAMQQEPTSSYTAITNDLKVPANATEGASVTPFPAANEIRWLETPFLSTDPSSPLFLAPDWNNILVQNYIVDKGWEAAGVKDPDGSRADLGAVPQGGGRPIDVVTIRPAVPFRIGSNPATLVFTISPRVGTMTEIKLRMIGLVRNLDTTDIFGSAYKAITTTNIIPIAPSAQTLTLGVNSIEVPPAESIGDFGFFEIFTEGIGSDGRLITTTAGFIPYRKIDNTFEIAILNAVGGAPVSEVRGGIPVTLSIKAINGSMPYSGTVAPTSISLSSRGILLDAAGKPVSSVPAGISGTTEIAVVFPTVSAVGIEHVLIAGRSVSGSNVLSFFGSSPAVTILPDPTILHPIMDKNKQPGQYRYEVIDLQGRVVRKIDGIENNLASNAGKQIFGCAGHGVYLVRMVDRTTGRATQVRRLNLGQ